MGMSNRRFWSGAFIMKSLLLAALAGIVCCSSSLLSAAEPYPRSNLLLEPAELAKPEAASRFVILDARPQAEYAEGHVPGARWVDHGEWAKAFGDGEDRQGWSERIGALGIGRDTPVVVYDDSAMKDAARIWWILRYWGVADVRLLNGGWKTWKAEEFPISTEKPAPPQSVAFRAKPRPERLATKSDVLELLKESGLQVVDARSEGEFCGTAPLGNKRAGAIPGARHLEWSDLVDQKTHRFMSAEQLATLFRATGIDLNRPTASHCQSGGRASVMAFGLELMGAEDVRNYYRGWSEWGNAEDTPVEPGKK
jgi:thiosulfate/3-mercaptopyruvate sulfurtransferase